MKTRIYLLPNLLTALGLTCGLFVIFKINMVEVGKASEEVLRATAVILLLGAVFDLLDGAIARAMKAVSDFGGLFDSLADAVTFGVAPSVIVLKSLPIATGTLNGFLITAGALVFSICGVLRLVRFNVTAAQEKGNEELELASKKNFTGLPIPAAAAAMVSLNLFLVSADLHLFWIPSDAARLWILCGTLFVLGYFMISRWKFPSAKNLHFRVGSFQVVLAVVLFAVLVFYGLMHHFAWVFFFLSWAYLVLAWTLSTIRLIAGRKSKTLEEFEPEEELIDAEDAD